MSNNAIVGVMTQELLQQRNEMLFSTSGENFVVTIFSHQFLEMGGKRIILSQRKNICGNFAGKMPKKYAEVSGKMRLFGTMRKYAKICEEMWTAYFSWAEKKILRLILSKMGSNMRKS